MSVQKCGLLRSDWLSSCLLVTSLFLLLLLFWGLFLGVDEKTDLAHDLHELSLAQLLESVAQFRALHSEDSLQKMLILQEGNLGVLIVNKVEHRILHLSLLDVDICVLEHCIEGILISHAG